METKIGKAENYDMFYDSAMKQFVLRNTSGDEVASGTLPGSLSVSGSHMGPKKRRFINPDLKRQAKEEKIYD